ncbi:hypothetical protein NL676_001876 [Syzygium grande]|nr:hypothetical protein NL676_001876 [Syzygium grande]
MVARARLIMAARASSSLDMAHLSFIELATMASHDRSSFVEVNRGRFNFQASLGLRPLPVELRGALSPWQLKILNIVSWRST